jgi:type IV secretory pathway ATPase VirB11/archaellum biosynthesis ATPase
MEEITIEDLTRGPLFVPYDYRILGNGETIGNIEILKFTFPIIRTEKFNIIDISSLFQIVNEKYEALHRFIQYYYFVYLSEEEKEKILKSYVKNYFKGTEDIKKIYFKVKELNRLTPYDWINDPSLVEETKHYLLNFFSEYLIRRFFNSKVEFEYKKFGKEDIKKGYYNKIVNSSVYPYFKELFYYDMKEMSFLSFLLRDENIEEIYIGSANDINFKKYLFYLDHRKYGRLVLPITFSNDTARTFFQTYVASFMRRVIGEGSPLLNSRVPIGRGARFQITTTPVALSTKTYANARLLNTNPFNPIKILKFKSMPVEILPYFIYLFRTQGNFLTNGPTGSGKTTLLNALVSFAPLTLRVITVEETPEISLNGFPFVVREVSTEKVPLYSVVSAGRRQTPQLFIIGELTGIEEMKAFLNIASAGQSNLSIGTFHASDVIGLINRFRDEVHASLEQIKKIDVLVFQNKILVKEGNLDKVKRVVTGIYETIPVLTSELLEEINEIARKEYGKTLEELLQIANSLEIGRYLVIKIGSDLVAYSKIMDYDIAENKFRVYDESLRNSRIVKQYMNKLKYKDYESFKANIHSKLVKLLTKQYQEGYDKYSFEEYVKKTSNILDLFEQKYKAV